MLAKYVYNGFHPIAAKKRSEMSTLVIFEAQVRHGFAGQTEQMLREQLSSTRSFAGCQGIVAYWGQHGADVGDLVSTGPRGGRGDSADAGHRLVMIQYWDSPEAYHKYVSWRMQAGDLQNFVSICEGPPDVRVCDQIDI